MRKGQLLFRVTIFLGIVSLFSGCGGDGSDNGNNTNSAPMANAGPDQNVVTGDNVTLDGSTSSDPDGDSLTYIWSITSVPTGSSAVLNDTTASRPIFTADLDGDYIFNLIVNDGLKNSAVDSVTITAATANTAPIANAGPDQNVATGDTVTLDGTGSSDANGGSLTYTWSISSSPSNSSANLNDPSAAQPTFTADFSGNYVFNLVVNDGFENSTADNVTITATHCPVLTASTGNIVNVSNVTELTTAVTNAQSGDAILLADGNYQLDNTALFLDVPNVKLRSASGNREAVVLDSNYLGTSIINILASNITVADLTIRESFNHPIQVYSGSTTDITGTLIYNVHILDPRNQAITVMPSGTAYADNGVIACSTIELTDTGRPNVDPSGDGCYTGGISLHETQNWVVRDNTIQGFWCDTGEAEHAVHSWVGSRDTLVERNTLIDNARGIGFGLANSGSARTYGDAPCPGVTGYIGHYGGIARNNFIFASDTGLFGSQAGNDCGICLASACSAKAVHNTVVSTDTTTSSIQWRFATSSSVEVSNNIVTHSLLSLNGASATLSGNLESATLDLFIDGANGNLHLAPGATTAIDQGVNLAAGVCADDIDGQARDTNPDIGADER